MEPRPYHFHGNSRRHHFAEENRCYIDHRGERTQMSDTPTFSIRTEVQAEPKPGAFYKDNDDDLFIWIGGDSYPWLEITPSGTATRRVSYPVEPLLELAPEEYQDAINSKRLS